MNFTMLDNQHGQLVTQAVDASGAPSIMPSDVSAVSSDPTIATVVPDPSGVTGTFLVTAVKAGTVNIVESGTNSAGATATATFAFTLTGGPAVGFTGSLVNVANN